MSLVIGNAVLSVDGMIFVKWPSSSPKIQRHLSNSVVSMILSVHILLR